MRKTIVSAWFNLLSCAAGLTLIFPLFYTLLGAFKTAPEFASYPPSLLPESFLNLENFRQVLTGVPMARYMLNSLLTSFITGSVKVTFAALAAYAFAFFDFRGKNILFLLIVCTMMLPPETLTITNYRTVSRLGLTDTYLGICVVSFVGASQMFMLRQQMNMLPGELRDAAAIDGCPDLVFMIRITLPMSKDILTTLFLQSFINQWNSYLWPLIVTGKETMRTVQVGLSMLTNTETANYEIVLAGACIALVPSLILFFLSRRTLGGNLTAGAVVE